MFVDSVHMAGFGRHMVDHWMDLLTGAAAGTTFFQLLGHAVNTFPPPENKYRKWALGVLQWWVGQRDRAGNTMGNTQQLQAAAAKSTGA